MSLDKRSMGPSSPLAQEIRTFLAMADEAWRTGDFSGLEAGLKACATAMSLLKTVPQDTESNVEGARLAGEAWAQWGHLHEAKARRDGDGTAWAEAARAYERAIDCLRHADSPAAEAGAWMNRGNILKWPGTPESAKDAILCYDRTIALLAWLPADAPLEHRTMLGAAWLNRGAAHELLGDEAGRTEARRCLEQAIAWLEPWIDEHWLVRRNQATAWTNLGRLRLEAGDTTGAVAAQEMAAALLEPLSGRTELHAERTAILLNLGQARKAAGDGVQAKAAAHAALACARTLENAAPQVAEMALRARHLACLAATDELSGKTAEARAALLSETDDLVDEGLGLAREWRQRGTPLGEADSRLFAFGAWFHRTWQPRQFTPFLLEHLENGGEERAQIAWTEISWVRQQLVQRGFASGDMERAAAWLAEMREVEERLRALSKGGNKGT